MHNKIDEYINFSIDKINFTQDSISLQKQKKNKTSKQDSLKLWILVNSNIYASNC